MRSSSTNAFILFFTILSCSNEVSENGMFARKQAPQAFNYLKNHIIYQDKSKEGLFVKSIDETSYKKINNFCSLLSSSSSLKYSFSENKDSNNGVSDSIGKEKIIFFPEFVRVIIQNREKKFLVLRTKYGDKYFWIFPGGKVEKGESLSDTVKRQVLEETGLNISYYTYLGEFMTPKPYKGIYWKGYVYLANTRVNEIINFEPSIYSELAFKSYEELLPLVLEEDSYVTELILKQFISKL